MAITTAAAILGAAVVGGAATAYAGSKAAKASETATATGTSLQREQYQQSRADQQPFMQAGYGAANALTGRLGLATQGVSSAAGAAGGATAGAPDLAAYRANDPGVEAEFNKVRATADPNSPQWQALGLDSLDNWTATHSQRTGRPMPTVQTQAAPTPAPAQAAGGNALTGADPGTFGNTANPSYTQPTAYQAPPEFSFSVDSFKDNPAYKFAQEEGLGSVQAGAFAGGYGQSGAAMKAILDRGQKTAYQFYAPERDFAFNQYTDSRNFGRASYDTDRAFGRQTYENDRNYLTDRYDTQTGNLFNMMNVGQSAASQTANAGQNYANNVTGLVQGNAANQGNAAIAGANSMNSLLGAGVNAYAYGNALRGGYSTPGAVPGYTAGNTGYRGASMTGLY